MPTALFLAWPSWLNGVFWNQLNNQLPVGLSAQLVERWVHASDNIHTVLTGMHLSKCPLLILSS